MEYPDTFDPQDNWQSIPNHMIDNNFGSEQEPLEQNECDEYQQSKLEKQKSKHKKVLSKNPMKFPDTFHPQDNWQSVPGHMIDKNFGSEQEPLEQNEFDEYH